MNYQLENTVPLVLYGYGAYEALESLYAKDWVYVLHGSLIFTGCLTSHNAGKMRMVVYGLVVEISQVFFNAGLMYKRYYELKTLSPWFFIPFLGSFYIGRWIVFPYEYTKFIRNSYMNPENYEQEPLLINLITIAGGIVNTLNFVWGIMILSKTKRILSRSFQSSI